MQKKPKFKATLNLIQFKFKASKCSQKIQDKIQYHKDHWPNYEENEPLAQDLRHIQQAKVKASNQEILWTHHISMTFKTATMMWCRGKIHFFVEERIHTYWNLNKLELEFLGLHM